jgi:hypothetical protein
MTRASVLSAILLIVLCPASALAWLRPTFEDATVVARSELIVVARLKPGSIQKLIHVRNSASWEYHATLVISSVLNGKCDKKEIPVVIHYGLTPVERVAEKGGIEILDTGSSDRGAGSLVKDAGQDNLWFLRKRSGYFGDEPGTGNYGVVDPEDIQPLELKPYFLSYLARDPEAAVKDFARMNPAVAERAKRYLDHLEVQRILKIEDVGKRYDALLPLFLARTTWNMKEEASAGIVACGAKAGERLKSDFADPKYRNFRYQILRMWGDMNYREIAPDLIALLKEHDRFWAAQELKKGWWNDDSKPELTSQRQEIYGEVYAAACTLRTLCDPRAKDVLELTRARWSAIKFDNTQIVEECESALRELAAKEEPKKPAEDKQLALASVPSAPPELEKRLQGKTILTFDGTIKESDPKNPVTHPPGTTYYDCRDTYTYFVEPVPEEWRVRGSLKNRKVFHGLRIVYDKSGQILRIENYYAGVLHGQMVAFQDGKRWYEITYKFGLRDGISRHYVYTGKLLAEEEFKEEKCISYRSFNDDGKPDR